jgi:hypothetical protein
MYLSCVPKFFLPKKSKNRILFDKLEIFKKVLDRQIDIRNIVTKMNDVDKLSFLFFGRGLRKLEMSRNPYLDEDKGKIDDKILDFHDETSFQNYIISNYRKLISYQK